MSERRVIEGFPDYAVDDDGVVWRIVAQTSGRRWKNKAIPYALKPGVAAKTGYLMVVLTNESGNFTKSIHRLVAEAFLGPSYGRYCCHNDGTRTNNRVSNLRWGTQSENMLDCNKHGTDRRGEKCPLSKMTAADVAWIRAYPKTNGMFSKMARRLNLSRQTIREAYLGITWGHLPTEGVVSFLA